MVVMNPPLRLLTAFQDAQGTTPDVLVEVPGRAMWLAAQPSENHRQTLTVPDLEGSTIFDLQSAKQLRTIRNRPLPKWARFPARVLRSLAAQPTMTFPGMACVVVGDEPTGPRYEYSLGMAYAALWYQLNEMTVNEPMLIELLEHVQRDVLRLP